MQRRPQGPTQRTSPAHALRLQKLKVGAGTILTLDGRRITSQGIVSGASFRVIPVEQADVRFGGSGAVGEVSGAAWDSPIQEELAC